MVSLWLLAVAMTRAGASALPNIIIIVADDLGYVK